MHEVALVECRQLRIDMTIRYKEIDPTVIVVVKKLGSPPDVRQAHRRDFGSIRDISERVVAVIPVKRVVVVVKICNEQIQFLIVIVIANSHAHTSLLTAVLIYCRSRLKTDLLKRAIAVVV